MNVGRIGLGLGFLAWGLFVALVFRDLLREPRIREAAAYNWRFQWWARRRGVTREAWLERQVRFWSRYGAYVFAPFFIIWFALCVWLIADGF